MCLSKDVSSTKRINNSLLFQKSNFEVYGVYDMHLPDGSLTDRNGVIVAFNLGIFIGWFNNSKNLYLHYAHLDMYTTLIHLSLQDILHTYLNFRFSDAVFRCCRADRPDLRYLITFTNNPRKITRGKMWIYVRLSCLPLYIFFLYGTEAIITIFLLAVYISCIIFPFFIVFNFLLNLFK